MTGIRTGWPPGLLQDDDKKLSKWLSNRPDSNMRAREAVQKIHDARVPSWTVEEWSLEQERRAREREVNAFNLFGTGT